MIKLREEEEEEGHRRHRRRRHLHTEETRLTRRQTYVDSGPLSKSENRTQPLTVT